MDSISLTVRGLCRFPMLSQVKIGILCLSRMLSFSFKFSNVLTQCCSKHPLLSFNGGSICSDGSLFIPNIGVLRGHICFSLDQFQSGVCQFYCLFKEPTLALLD